MSAAAAAAAKRMALSRDQRSVLEAVYSIEKLPDAPLRERLSKYLDLSTRQIQVWFQNRRQRAKAGSGLPKRPALSTPSQIMDALFEFSGNLGGANDMTALSGLAACCATDATLRTAAPRRTGGGSSSSSSGSSTGSITNDLLPAAAFASEGLEWGMSVPPAPPLAAVPPQRASQQAAGPAIRPGAQPIATLHGSRVPSTAEPSRMEAQAVTGMRPSVAMPVPPVTACMASNILDAVLGFACHEMGLEAVELWPLPMHGVTPSEPVFTRLASPQPSPAVQSELACCRAMLAPRLCESAACTLELAWYGVSPDQKEALSRTGVALRTMVGVPCLEPPSCAARGFAGMAVPICGVLVLYTRRELLQSEAFGMLLHAIGSASAAAYALGMSMPKTLTSPLKYTSMPAELPTASFSWLLLAAAHTLQVDIAEHWTARQLPASRGGAVYMTAEQILVADWAVGLPELVLATGEAAEVHHPFSSHMSRASLYAGKLVWCNGTSATGMLEGIKAPMQTAIGLPLRSHVGGGATFVFYSQRRLEQSAAVTFFLAQLQVLAAASQVAGPHGSLDRLPSQTDTDPLGPTVTKREALTKGKMAKREALTPSPLLTPDPEPCDGTTDRNLAVNVAPSATLLAVADISAPRSHDSGSHGFDTSPPATLAQESVMSTEQVLSLIECLGEATRTPSRGMSRAASMTALAALEPAAIIEEAFSSLPAEEDLQQRSVAPPAVPMRHAGCSDDLDALGL